TAPSTQPPETLPATWPSSATSIAAPGWRGAERKVATTVPSAVGRPSCQFTSTMSRTSRTPHLRQQFVQRGQAVPGEQPVDVRHGRGDPGLYRGIARTADVRVAPQDGVREPAQPRQLLAEQRRVAPFPPVREHHRDGLPRQPAMPPAIKK